MLLFFGHSYSCGQKFFRRTVSFANFASDIRISIQHLVLDWDEKGLIFITMRLNITVHVQVNTQFNKKFNNISAVAV